MNKTVKFHESLQKGAPHRGLPVSQSRATSQMIPSAPLGSTREAQTVRSSAALHCTGFKIWVPTDLRYAATALRVSLRPLLPEAATNSWDVEFLDVTKYWHTPRPDQQNGPAVEIAKPWIGSESASCDPCRCDVQQLWREHFNR